MMTHLKNALFGKDKLTIPVEDMPDVLRYQKRRHAALHVDSETNARKLALYLRYEGTRVVLRGVIIEPGKVVLGRRYEG